jgi:hypothetical protein
MPMGEKSLIGIFEAAVHRNNFTLVLQVSFYPMLSATIYMATWENERSRFPIIFTNLLIL